MNTGKSYNTRQRDAVLAFFEAHPDTCFSAADILRQAGLSVGEATVYRCLNRFAEEGLLQKFSGEGGAQYRFARRSCHAHFHLKCLRCGKLIHMDCGCMAELEAHVAAAHDFEIDRTHTTLYGVCADCKG